MNKLLEAIEQRYIHTDDTEFCIKCDIIELVKEAYPYE